MPKKTFVIRKSSPEGTKEIAPPTSLNPSTGGGTSAPDPDDSQPLVRLKSPPSKEEAREIVAIEPEDSRNAAATGQIETKFRFFCYRCGQKLKVSISWVGERHNCPSCLHSIVVPCPLEDDES